MKRVLFTYPFLTIFFSLILLIGQKSSAQVSDACAGAIPIACGQTLTGTTTGNTGDVIPAACNNNGSPGVWYQFTGTGVNTVFSLCGSGYDTRLAVFTGSCAALTCVTTNDDFCGLQSQVSITTTLATTYYILVYGFGVASSGNFSLNVTCVTPQANETCAAALPIICGQTITGNTTGAAADAIPAGCFVTNTAPGLWYAFTGTGEIMIASLCGSSFDSQISVLTGTCGSLTCQATSDDFCGAQSQVSVNTTAGVTYYIYVFGYGANAGSFSLNVTCVTPPPNDLCTGAIPVICGSSVTGSTLGASGDVLPAGCYLTNTAPGVWYSFAGNGQIMIASLCGSAYETQISVFSGTCGALTCAGYNDDYCGDQSQISTLTTVGVTYYIFVTGLGNASGNFTFNVTCATPPANDPCSGAIPIVCGGTVTGNTNSASADVIPAGCFVSTGSPGVWYSFPGNGSLMTLSLCGSGYDTQLSIFTGTCASLTCVSFNDDYLTCGLQSQLTISSLNGVTYYVYVHGDNSSGSFSLSLTCPPPPATCNSTEPNGCPDIDLGVDISLPTCTSPCTDVPVVADYFLTGTTTSYATCNIPYAPYPYNTGTGFSIGTDDIWTPAINLPFNFCFYGVNYNQCVVGSNGVISFNTAAYASGYCSWAFTDFCPNAALPLNSIFGVYHDIDPSIYCGASPCGDARYATFGVPPCRVFVVSWDNLPHFSGVCNSLRTTCEIVLYETTNVIEVFIENKPLCNTWNSGNALVGIQNATGSAGVSPPGRNTGQWTAVNEGWRFTPNGASNTVIQWYQQGSATVIGTGPTINVCPTQTSQTYLATATYTKCDGTQIVVNDDIIVQCAMFLVPVEWHSFDAKPSSDESYVECQWSTASEQNNDYFTIERSPDGESWTAIGTTNSRGESSVLVHYLFQDHAPLQGTNYYRIKQTDLNGESDHSEIRRVNINRTSTTCVFPNPASGHLVVSPWKSSYVIRVFENGGREVKCSVSESGVLDVSTLGNGLYHLEIADRIAGEIMQRNFQVQH